MQTEKIVKFQGYSCVVVQDRYHQTGYPALQLVSAESDPKRDLIFGEPIAKATVNPDEPLLPGEVAIKDWSENSGMVEAMMDAGVIHDPHRFVRAGAMFAPVARLK